MRRFVFLGIALGLASALLGGLLTLSACYDLPTPVCGFRCGPTGECPDDYTCNAGDSRCHLNGSDPTLICGTIDDESDGPLPDSGDAPLFDDVSTDTPPDVPPDTPPDVPPDTPPDVPPDASDATLDAGDAGTDAADAAPPD